MKSILRILILLVPFLLSLHLVAQEEKVTKVIEDDDGYPITNEIDPEMAVFISTFQDLDIGNLQVYTCREEPVPESYFFKGKAVEPVFFPLFDEKMEEWLLKPETRMYAAYKIKGNAGQRYIMRMSTDDGEDLVALFERTDGDLTLIQKLAFFRCQGEVCTQQDAWIVDLDGDTDLDLLFKRRSRKGTETEKASESVKALLQDDRGFYQEAGEEIPGLKLRLNRFRMQDLTKDQG